MTPSQADEASLGPEYGEPTGVGRMDGGVRMVDLGLNLEVTGGWPYARQLVLRVELSRQLREDFGARGTSGDR